MDLIQISPISQSCSFSDPGSHITISCCVSSVSSNLWCLCLSLSFTRLTLWRSTGHLFCSTALGLDLFDVFLMIRFRLCALGRNTVEVMPCLWCLMSGGPWCWEIPWLITLVLITCRRHCLSSISSVNLLFFTQGSFDANYYLLFFLTHIYWAPTRCPGPFQDVVATR